MYKPPEFTVSIDPPIRLAVVGPPGGGKTYFAKSFPNPFFLDFDHKLPPGIESAPFWSAEFVDNLFTKRWKKARPRSNPAWPPNRRDAAKQWLHEEIEKFHPEQTLILDGWSALQTAHDQQAECELPRPWTKDQGYQFWREKSQFSRDICESLMRAKCMVVVTVHEMHETDDENRAIEKLKPFQQGGFAHEFAGKFTDVYRAVVDPKVPDPNNPLVNKVMPGNYIQLISDRYFDCNCNPAMSSVVRAKNMKYIPNNYEAWRKLLSS